MVLLSLGSGLITALLAQAKPSYGAVDWDAIAHETPVADDQDSDQAQQLSNKTPISQ